MFRLDEWLSRIAPEDAVAGEVVVVTGYKVIIGIRHVATLPLGCVAFHVPTAMLKPRRIPDAFASVGTGDVYGVEMKIVIGTPEERAAAAEGKSLRCDRPPRLTAHVWHEKPPRKSSRKRLEDAGQVKLF